MEDNKGIKLSVEINSFLQSLIDSKKLPSHIETVHDAFTIAQMGKELGLATMQAFHYIIPVKGRLTLSAKAVGALLRKGGISYTTEEDGVYVYPDGSVSDAPAKGDQKPIDQRTTIVFRRGDATEKCSYTWRDAEAQGLTTKDNWKRLRKEMLYARCIAKGANRIGPDILLGLYTTDEITDTYNFDESQIKRDLESGTVTEIITEKDNNQ